MAIERRKRPSMKPYLLACTLLYGRFTWIKRHVGGTITLSVGPAVKHYRTRAPLLKQWLDLLYRVGIISKLDWQGHWVNVEMSVPSHMARLVDVMDVGTIIDVEGEPIWEEKTSKEQ